MSPTWFTSMHLSVAFWAWKFALSHHGVYFPFPSNLANAEMLEVIRIGNKEIQYIRGMENKSQNPNSFSPLLPLCKWLNITILFQSPGMGHIVVDTFLNWILLLFEDIQQ